MGKEVKGPDGKPVPKDFPPKGERKLKKPGGAVIAGGSEAVEADIKAHPDKKEGTVEIELPPGSGNKHAASWKVLDGGKWTWTIGPMTVTVERTSESSTQYIVEPPPPVRRAFMNVCFSASGACKDIVWVQYKEVSDRLFEGSNEVKPTNPLPGAGIDGQVPYEFQEQNSSGGATMSDQPALPPGHKPSETDGDVASAEVKKIGDKEAPGKTITKVERTETFWSYEICVDPYDVIGHYKWSFKVTLDPSNTAEPIKVSDKSGPTWTKD